MLSPWVPTDLGLSALMWSAPSASRQGRLSLDMPFPLSAYLPRRFLLTLNDQPSSSSFPEPSIALPGLLRSPVPKLSANWYSPACYQLAKSPTTSCIEPGEERPEHSTMLTTDQETEPERSRATAEATQQGGGELPVKSACLSAPMWELSPPQAAEAQQEEPWGLLLMMRLHK